MNMATSKIRFDLPDVIGLAIIVAIMAFVMGRYSGIHDVQAEAISHGVAYYQDYRADQRRFQWINPSHRCPDPEHERWHDEREQWYKDLASGGGE